MIFLVHISTTALLISYCAPKISVVINGIEIEHVPSFNFLGIMLDENLSWKSRIEMVGNKISKVTGILYRLKNVFPENVLFVLYNSYRFVHKL